MSSHTIRAAATSVAAPRGSLSETSVVNCLTTYSRSICEGCTPTLCGLFTETWRCPPAQVARMRAQAIRDHRARELRRRVDLALARAGGAA